MADAGAGTSADGIYRISARSIDGRETSLGEYRGKVLLIVNTASRCGFTPQYRELERMFTLAV
jgi:glutathione peroxidase